MTLVHKGNAMRWGHAVPKHLRARFSGKAMINKSLTTRDHKLAISFAAYLSNSAVQLFKLADLHSDLTTREISLLVENLQSLTETVETRAGGRNQAALLEEDLRVAMEHRSRLQPGERALISLRQRLSGLVDDIESYLGAESDKTSKEQHGAKNLSDVMLEYLKERSLNVATRTVGLRRAYLRALLLIVGDKDITAIRRNELGHFKSVVQHLRVRWQHTYPGVPITEILAKSRHERPLEPETVNNYINTIHAFFEWAYLNGYIEFNPARKLQLRLKRSPQDRRKRLYSTDLRQLFEESLYFARADNRAAIRHRKIDVQVYHFFGFRLSRSIQGCAQRKSSDWSVRILGGKTGSGAS